MKSAYELALERLQNLGIEPPSENLDPSLREQIRQLQSQAEAKLAELEILHRDRLRKTAEPGERATAEEEYRLERRRVEAERDRKIQKLRGTPAD